MATTLRPLLALLLFSLSSLPLHAEPLCLWVSSYHIGYEWNDGIGRGIREGVAGVCQLEEEYLDTKRNPAPAFGEQRAREVFARIQSLKPDVIILSDDNASRYLAQPYLKQGDIPLVFCGINWEGTAYGYPWENATGMLEIAPVTALLKDVARLADTSRHGLYLSSSVYTETIDARHYQRAFALQGVNLAIQLVDNQAQWNSAYIQAQQEGLDFILLGNNAGINDWDPHTAREVAFEHASALTLTNYEWMMPYAMLGKVKLPEEQGSWAAQVAAEILAGTNPALIPVVSNRNWRSYVNPRLLQQAGIEAPADLIHNAIKVE